MPVSTLPGGQVQFILWVHQPVDGISRPPDAGENCLAISDTARRNLVQDLAGTLRSAILSGDVPVGGKLPSEAQLTHMHAVSRTVVREAIAALRAEGMVEARQGAGVFVLKAIRRPDGLLHITANRKPSDHLDMMEFRAAVETEAAALAAARRSAAQEAAIVRSLAPDTGTPISDDQDHAFHLAVADAAGNPRFRELLDLLGPAAFTPPDATPETARQTRDDHLAISQAISAGDADAARSAMADHLGREADAWRASAG